jgi:cytochrome c6
MRTLYAATTITVLALTFAACGGSSDSGTSEAPPQSADKPESTEKKAGGGEGEQLFASNCGSCHVLSAAGTAGAVGPNLDDLKPSKASVVSVVTNGMGAMPSFSDSLSSTEIDEVAAYVSKNAGQ